MSGNLPAHFSASDLLRLVENIPDIVCSFRFEPEQRIDYINNAIVDWTLYQPSEFYNDSQLFSRIIHPQDLELVESMLREGHPEQAVFRMCRRDGRIFRVQGNFTDLYTRDQHLIAIQAVLRVLPEEKILTAQPVSFEPDQRIQRYAEKLTIISDIGRTLGETLSLPDIYQHLAQAVHRLFPDINAQFISIYHPEVRQITCAYAIVDGEILDPADFPAVELNPSPVATQSQAILRHEPIIIPDLVAHRGGPQNLGVLVGGDDNGLIPRSAMYVPMLSQNKVLGVVQIQSTLLNRFEDDDARLLAVVANTAAIVLQNATTHSQLMDAYDRTLEGWGHAVDLRDHETENHSLKVADMTHRLAGWLGIGGEMLTHLRRGALLHDIGKLGVPDKILYKAGKLDAEEWEEMRKHPQYAFDMLKSINFLQKSIDIPYAHHEKWDGSGYPRGLRGADIPIGARIFAVVDVWDALLSDRPYRPAWEREKVIAYIRANTGSHFDPHVAEVFLMMIEENG